MPAPIRDVYKAPIRESSRAAPGGKGKEEAGSARDLTRRGHVLHFFLKSQWKATEMVTKTDSEEADFGRVVGIVSGPESHIFKDKTERSKT